MATAETAPNFSGPLGGVRQALKCCLVSAALSPHDKMKIATHNNIHTPTKHQYCSSWKANCSILTHCNTSWLTSTTRQLNMISIWVGDSLKILHTSCFNSLETNSSWSTVDTVSLLNSLAGLYNVKIISLQFLYRYYTLCEYCSSVFSVSREWRRWLCAIILDQVQVGDTQLL